MPSVFKPTTSPTAHKMVCLQSTLKMQLLLPFVNREVFLNHLGSKSRLKIKECFLTSKISRRCMKVMLQFHFKYFFQEEFKSFNYTSNPGKEVLKCRYREAFRWLRSTIIRNNRSIKKLGHFRTI